MHPLLRLLALYRNHLGLAAVVVLGLGLVNLAQPATAWLVGRAVEALRDGSAVRHLADGSLDASGAWFWVWVLVGVTVLRGLLQYGATIVAMVLGQRLLHTLRDRIFDAVQHLDLAWHRTHGAGEVINRTTRDSDLVRDAIVGGSRSLFELIMVVVGTLGLLLWYHWILALVPTLLVATAIWIMKSQASRLVALDRAAAESYDAVSQELSEGVNGVRVIKAFALEGQRVDRFTGKVDAFTAKARAAIRYTAARLPFPQLIVSLGHVWVLGCGGWLVTRGELTPGDLIAAMMVIQGLVFRVEAIGWLVRMFADASSSAGRIVEILDARPTIAQSLRGSNVVPEGPLGVRLEQVVVRIAGRPVLDGVDLTLEPGTITALVGATGSGKTTLAQLVPRLRDPESGRVLVRGGDGAWLDLRSFDPQAWRRRCQLAFQEAFLFSDTMAANLRLVRPEADEDELREALRLAAADEVAASLNDGLDGRIGERGVTLSGGQRQRVCLARALLARPAVLVLDDATSALDAVTETRVLANLRSHLAATAVLMVCAKPATCAAADRVVMLRAGRIAAAGTHTELAAANHLYRDLLGLDREAAA